VVLEAQQVLQTAALAVLDQTAQVAVVAVATLVARHLAQVARAALVLNTQSRRAERLVRAVVAQAAADLRGLEAPVVWVGRLVFMAAVVVAPAALATFEQMVALALRASSSSPTTQSPMSASRAAPVLAALAQ
jgi:hypothetical protein